MEEKIVNLINRYVRCNLDVDFYFVNEAVDIAKEYYGLNDYIERLRYYNFSKKIAASYTIETKTLCTNISLIMSKVSKLNKEFNTIDKSKVFKYIYTIHIIFHEIEHAYQQKQIKENKDMNDIEALILRDEYFPLKKAQYYDHLYKAVAYKQYGKLCVKYYLFSPSERLAEINSFRLARDVSFVLDDENSYNFMEYFRLKNMLRGFNVGIVNNLSDEPTKYYLDKINSTSNYNTVLELSNGLKPNDLMKYGLDTPEENLHIIARERFEMSLKLNRKKR